MNRRVIYVLSFVFVLVIGNNVSAELVAHWKFDDGAGNTATDSVGNAHPGTVGGIANWVDGQIGGALDFDGLTNYVDIGGDMPIISGTFSLTMWIYARDIPTVAGDLRMPLSNDTWADRAIHVHIWPETAVFRIDTKNGTDISSNTVIQADQWYHVAGTLDAAGESKIYINGILDNSTTGDGREYIIGPANIGAYQESSRFFNGMIDDVRIYNHILSEAEIQQIMKSEQGVTSKPWPTNEATDVPRDVVLSWTPGKYAPAVNGHVVYFGTVFADVNAGIDGVTLSDASYVPSQRLAFETTYYWRVDEVNAPPDSTVFKGNVWNFTTEPIGYPIDGTNITATASSAAQVDLGPENTINGSGLGPNDLHSTEATDMWLSGNEAQGAWIQYEFDKIYKLHEMWVWNSNQLLETYLGFGLKDVEVEYSTDGTEWTVLSDAPEFSQAPGTNDYAHNTTIDFGGSTAKYVRLTAISNWAGVLPQYGLSEVRFFSIPVNAREPSPDSGATDVTPDVSFHWRAGREAVQHSVYLSTDQQTVIDGTAPSISVTDTSYNATLDLGNTYYWRVDEVNSTETPAIWQGDVWDFATQQYIVVEDFEDYNDYPPYEIYSTWLDGYENPTNGSQVGYVTAPAAETAIVHSGKQSMPLFYSNTGGATYSEAKRTFVIAQDWIKYGIQTLQLWFYGTADNTGQLYVKINGAKIPYDGDIANLTLPSWQSWDIDLTTVSVNLQSVTSLAIGIDGNAASGTLYIDDIRLCAYSRQLIPPTEPGTVGLVAHWRFDDGAGNMAMDSVGNAHPGTIGGIANWVAGKDGGALDFDGSTNYVDIQGDNPIISGTFSLMMWIYARDIPTPDFRMPLSNDEWVDGAIHVHIVPETSIFKIDTKNGTDISSNTVLQADRWYHIASTLDAVGESKIYIDGILDNSATGNSKEYFIGPANIGAYQNNSRFFNGMIDDVRIYNRILSETEIIEHAGQ